MKYFKELTSYGIIPSLLALEEFERREDYEVCQKMIETIKYLNSLLKKDRLPMKFTPMLKIDVKWTIEKMGLSSDNILDRSQEFKDIVIKQITNGN